MFYITHMKTIALSERAYTRLAVWKTGRSDTFSAVIERLIPPKGTLGAALEAVEFLPDWPPKEFASLEKTVNSTRKKLRPPWN